MRVQCCTFNSHLAKGLSLGDTRADLAAWLAPKSSASKDGAPDFVAVGYQEMIPMHSALTGLTSYALARHESQLLEAIESTYASSKPSTSPPRYRLLGQNSIGGIALLVYARKGTVAERVQSVEIATAGVGIGGVMGNKGAVGVRVTLVEPGAKEETTDGTSVWTFVSAHLAAHADQKQLERRNADWKSIVEKLVFVDEGGREAQLFDSGNVFFFGDLNYRTSLTSPTPLAIPDFSSHLHTLTTTSPSSPSYTSASSLLWSHDQLTQERTANRTLHHLQEGKLDGPPTYKFKLGTSEYTKAEKRVPSWTDRVLYASAGEVEVVEYGSTWEVVRSDHKPVSAIFSLSPKAASSRLPVSSPFPIDPIWRQKQLAGFVLDRLVGSVWSLLVLLGFNKDARIGTVNLLLALVTLSYRRTYM